MSISANMSATFEDEGAFNQEEENPVTSGLETGIPAQGMAVGDGMTANDHYALMMQAGYQEEEEPERVPDPVIEAQVEYEALMQVLGREARAAREVRELAEAERKAIADKKAGVVEEIEEEKDEGPLPENTVAGDSLFCISENSYIRHTLNKLVTHPLTENFLLLCILVNTAILAVQTPTNTLDNKMNADLNIVDQALSVVFSVEMIFRIIALGFIAEPSSYMRSSWNVLDFIVVMSIWVNVGVDYFELGEGENISYLRTLRALRPLRSLRFFSGIRVIMASLSTSIFMVANVTGILMFVFVIFSAVGLQLFAGALTQRCAAPEELLSNQTVLMECSVSMTCSEECNPQCRADCIENMYEFTGDVPDEINFYGFDHIGTSLMTLFITMTLDEWRQLADPIRSSDASGANFAWAYFAIVTAVCGLVVSNVYVAVIAFTFTKVREEHDGESAFADNLEKEKERASKKRPIILDASQHYSLMLKKDAAVVAAAEYKTETDVLRQELEEKKASALRNRALIAGADDDEFEAVDAMPEPKIGLIELVVAKEIPKTDLVLAGEDWNQDLEEEALKRLSQLRAKYNDMDMDELKRVALDEEINPVLLDSALELAEKNGENPKEALIAVLIGESDFFEGINLNIEHVKGRMFGRRRHPMLQEKVQIKARLVTLPGEFDDTDRILMVKKNIAVAQGIPIEDQRLVFDGTQLSDSKTLAEEGITNGDLIRLVSPEPLPYLPGTSEKLNVIVNGGTFEGFILFVVILNTFSLSAEHYGQTQEFTDALWYIDLVFNFIYVTELTMKLFGIGFSEYFRVPFNCMDISIVVSSLLQYSFSNLEGANAGRMLRILRLFRAARLVRALRKYDAVMILIKTVTNSGEALANVAFFNLVMLVIFAIMGVHLYGFDTPTFDELGLPRENFHTFGRAFLTCFQILTGEDWSPIMFEYMRAFGWQSSFFFFSLYIFTNFVMLNLFVAVILENFKVADEEKVAKQEKLYWDAERRRGRVLDDDEDGPPVEPPKSDPVAGWGVGWLGVWLASEEEKEAGTELRLQTFLQEQAANGGLENGVINPLAAKALEAPEEERISPLGAACRYISSHPIFEGLIITVILLSSVSLAVEGPPDAEYLEPYPEIVVLLEVSDVSFFIIFWVEFVLKVIGNGFWNKEGSYLSDGWNRLDFTVVFFTTIDFGLRYLAPGTDASWARVFRMLRVLRPLRIASKYENIRIIVDALIASISGVLATVVLAFFFILIFAIVGLNLFSGKFWSCTEDLLLSRVECEAARVECGAFQNHFNQTQSGERNSSLAEWGEVGTVEWNSSLAEWGELECSGYEWENADQHFDNVFNAFEALFITSTLEGWVDIMNNAIDVPNEIGEAPIENNNPWIAVYFLSFTVFTSFFVTNLFIGVLVMKFQESTGSSILTDEQRKWARFNMMIWMASMTPSEDVEKLDLARANPIKRMLHPIVNSAAFESILSFLIVTNVSLLMAEHFPQTAEFTEIVNVANFVYLVLFTVEIFMEVLASSPLEYWSSNWSKLDVIVVGTSWIFTVIGVQAGVQGARAVRFLRIIILFKHSKTIRRMVFTLVAAIAPATNVMMALLLALFIYAVVGMQFYGNLELIPGTRINELDNFKDIASSMRFLTQLATGQDLKSLITDIRNQDGFGIVPYLFSFYIVAIFVFLNLFVAVLLEAFEREFDEAIQLDVTVEDLTDLKDRWDKFCRELVSSERVVPPTKCFRKTLDNLPLRYIKEFATEHIPEGSNMGAFRDLPGDSWVNRLLLENLPDGLDPSQVHEAWQGTGADEILDDVLLEFERVAQSLSLMRTTVVKGGDSGLAGLSFGEKREKEKMLYEKRYKAAIEMLKVQVRAYKAYRSPGPEFVIALEKDPDYWPIYCRQVEISRILMLVTVIARTKIV